MAKEINGIWYKEYETEPTVEGRSYALYLYQCKGVVDDTAMHYKKIIKELRPYIADLKDLLITYEPNGYYSKSTGRVITKEDLRQLEYKIVGESYGA